MKEYLTRHVKEARVAVRTAAVAAMATLPTLTSYASDASGSGSLLEGEVLTAITNGFGSLAVAATQVVSIAVVTGVSVIGMSAAAKYAMKKIRGTLSGAA